LAALRLNSLNRTPPTPDLPSFRTRRSSDLYPVLVPNMRGFERAVAAGAEAIAVFTAATDAFTERNIGMTVDESLVAFAPVLAAADRKSTRLNSSHGSISYAVVCLEKETLR